MRSKTWPSDARVRAEHAHAVEAMSASARRARGSLSATKPSIRTSTRGSARANFLADEADFVQRALQAVVRIERHQDGDVAARFIRRRSGEHRRLPDLRSRRPSSGKPAIRCRLVKAPLGQRRPPGADAGRRGPWRDRDEVCGFSAAFCSAACGSPTCLMRVRAPK